MIKLVYRNVKVSFHTQLGFNVVSLMQEKDTAKGIHRVKILI